MGLSIFQILSLAFLFSYLLGILNIYFSDKNEYCEMTYMFEYPQFVVRSFFLLLRIWKFASTVLVLIQCFLLIFRGYLCQRMLYIHNMGFTHIVRAGLQKEPGRCGKFFLPQQIITISSNLKALINYPCQVIVFNLLLRIFVHELIKCTPAYITSITLWPIRVLCAKVENVCKNIILLFTKRIQNKHRKQKNCHTQLSLMLLYVKRLALTLTRTHRQKWLRAVRIR